MLAKTPTNPGVCALIDREVDALDQLLAELRLGPRDQRHFDALEERAQSIADGIRGAFRGNCTRQSQGEAR